MIPTASAPNKAMKHKSPQRQRLFLSASFETFQIGLASEDNAWILKNEQQGHIADQLSNTLAPIIERCHFDALTVHLLNGPGSTLGIRTLCAFVRTLLALGKIKPSQVFTCDHLHFAQACLVLRKEDPLPNICARVNLTKTLCLTPSNDLHSASEAEMQNAFWLPHPCLKNKKNFSFCLDEILPILQQEHLWEMNGNPDIASY